MTLQVARTTHRFRAADGTRLAYHVTGHGPDLFCLPGGPGRASTYLEDLAGLSAERRLTLLDARGTGASEHPVDGRLGFPVLADDVETLRAEVGPDRVALLGHSAGALVAQVYAARHPDRLRSLVLVTPPGSLHEVDRDDLAAIKARRADEEWYAASTAALQQPDDGSPDAARRRTLAFRPFMYGEWSPRQQAHAAAADSEQDAKAEVGFFDAEDLDPARVRDRLRGLACPVLVVAGELDAVTGVRAAEAVAAGLPGARLATLPGCGHFPWVDRPDDFRRTVSEFLGAAGV